jgi:hypothetical protein
MEQLEQALREQRHHLQVLMLPLKQRREALRQQLGSHSQSCYLPH